MFTFYYAPGSCALASHITLEQAGAAYQAVRLDFGANAQRGAEELLEFFEKFDDLPERAKRIKDIEHAGDELTHELIERLNKTFITPIDREDIHQLTSRLDDVIDLVHEVAEHLAMYRIREIRPDALELARIVPLATQQICAAIDQLDAGPETGRTHWVEINRLENEGDRIYRRAVADLFSGDYKAMDVLKWKEVIENLEEAVDGLENVANIIESTVLKHA